MASPDIPDKNESLTYVETKESTNRVSVLSSDRGKYLFVAGLALGVVILYIGVTAVGDQLGFPLDDSWIHQTYARNLVRSGRWEYVSGVVSAGSTAPLWTLLLAVGYLIGVPYFLWTFLLGGICLAWASWAAMRLWRVLWPVQAKLNWLVGIAIVLSWPLIWSAGSGMETLLFIALELELFYLYGLYYGGRLKTTAGLGLLTGLLVLTRPEGVALLALISVGLLIRGDKLSIRFKNFVILIGGAILPLIPYFAFNLTTSGNLWPNTFYAKQAEYAAIYAQPIFTRFIQLLYFSMGGASSGWQGISGAHLVLLPGVVVSGYLAVERDWHRREFYQALPLIWAIGLVFLYAWRLPVTYQHGRYLWPALPIWILYGVSGWLTIMDQLVRRTERRERLHFVLKRFGILTLVVLLFVFVLLGVQVFLQDVAFVNGEMVDIGQWINENTPDAALIAAHDIGAIGYVAERPLIDLAGLISPEVIPLLTDEELLMDYVVDRQADFLVTAPGWTYERLTSSERATHLYSTGYAWTLGEGVNNMEVYRLEK